MFSWARRSRTSGASWRPRSSRVTLSSTPRLSMPRSFSCRKTLSSVLRATMPSGRSADCMGSSEVDDGFLVPSPSVDSPKTLWNISVPDSEEGAFLCNATRRFRAEIGAQHVSERDGELALGFHHDCCLALALRRRNQRVVVWNGVLHFASDGFLELADGNVAEPVRGKAIEHDLDGKVRHLFALEETRQMTEAMDSGDRRRTDDVECTRHIEHRVGPG